MSKSKDIRTLCASCRAEYEEAGFELIKVWVKNKEECDWCRVRLGWTYEIRGKRQHLRSSDGKSAGYSQFRGREFKSRRRWTR